jgi:hypothetical protein
MDRLAWKVLAFIHFGTCLGRRHGHRLVPMGWQARLHPSTAARPRANSRNLPSSVARRRGSRMQSTRRRPGRGCEHDPGRRAASVRHSGRCSTPRRADPPVASRTMSVGARAVRRAAVTAIPSVSCVAVHEVPAGRQATAKSAFAMSMPTKIPVAVIGPSTSRRFVLARPCGYGVNAPRNCAGSRTSRRRRPGYRAVYATTCSPPAQPDSKPHCG